MDGGGEWEEGINNNNYYYYVYRKLLPERFIWKVMHQILSALEECHKAKENEGGKVAANCTCMK